MKSPRFVQSRMETEAVSDGVARLMWAVALLCSQFVGMGCANVSIQDITGPFLVSDQGKTREMHYVMVTYDGWRQLMLQDFRSYIGYMDTSVELTPENAREIMKVTPLRQYPVAVEDAISVFPVRMLDTRWRIRQNMVLLSLEPLVVGYEAAGEGVPRNSSLRYAHTGGQEILIDSIAAATRPWPQDEEYWQVWSDARPDDTYDRELEYQEYLRLFAPVTIELDAPMSARDAIQSRVWEQYLPQQSADTTAPSNDQ